MSILDERDQLVFFLPMFLIGRGVVAQTGPVKIFETQPWVPRAVRALTRKQSVWPAKAFGRPGGR
jgi:hypothetical protein